jgi:hypothetical protein
MPQPEAKFKAKMKEGFEKLYEFQPHFYFPLVASMMQLAGVPDVFVAAEQKCAWIEAKVNDGKLRTSQQLVLPKMAAAGTRVVVVDCDMNTEERRRPITIRQVSRLGSLELVEVHTHLWQALDKPYFWHAILGIPHAA